MRNKKYLLILLAWLISSDLYSQTFYEEFSQFVPVNQESLYISNRVKEINQFTQYNNSHKQHYFVWRFNDRGKIVFHETIDSEDSLMHITTYEYYSNDRLKQSKLVYSLLYMDKSIDLKDTIFKNYYYDSNGNLTRMEGISYLKEDSVIFFYTNNYSNDTLIETILVTKNSIDSTLYYPNGKPKKFINTILSIIDQYPIAKEETFYDYLGKIQSVIFYKFIENCEVATSIKNYCYNGHQLYLIKGCFMGEYYNREFSYSEDKLFYNDKNLLINHERYSNGEFHNRDIYTYSYY